MDWIGFFTFSSGLALLLLATTFLSYGLTGYESGLAMLAAGFILISLFTWHELHGKMKMQPLLDMKLFKIREFAGGISGTDDKRFRVVGDTHHGVILPTSSSRRHASPDGPSPSRTGCDFHHRCAPCRKILERTGPGHSFLRV